MFPHTQKTDRQQSEYRYMTKEEKIMSILETRDINALKRLNNIANPINEAFNDHAEGLKAIDYADRGYITVIEAVKRIINVYDIRKEYGV